MSLLSSLFIALYLLLKRYRLQPQVLCSQAYSNLDLPLHVIILQL